MHRMKRTRAVPDKEETERTRRRLLECGTTITYSSRDTDYKQEKQEFELIELDGSSKDDDQPKQAAASSAESFND